MPCCCLLFCNYILQRLAPFCDHYLLALSTFLSPALSPLSLRSARFILAAPPLELSVLGGGIFLVFQDTGTTSHSDFAQFLSLDLCPPALHVAICRL